MTREEAIKELKIQFVGEYDRQREAKDVAIKALEQEPILDKIRAEITKKHLSIVEKNDFDSGRTYGYEELLGIIDKYKAESEDKE